MREYQEEMKKEEERMRKCEEMHTDKMRWFDRLLDLYEKEISKQGLLLEKKWGTLLALFIVHNTFVLNNLQFSFLLQI